MARLERQRQPKSGLTGPVIAYLLEKAKSVSLSELSAATIAAPLTAEAIPRHRQIKAFGHPASPVSNATDPLRLAPRFSPG